MTYDISFNWTMSEGVRVYTWFVFDAEGKTLKSGFQNKSMAMAWALRELGWRQ